MTTATGETFSSGSAYGTRARDEGNGSQTIDRWRAESERTPPDAQRLAKALGWFSIGLGLAEIASPGRLARLIGVRESDANRRALQALGVREMASGLGILTQPRLAQWVWTRVAGDAMDLALLRRGLGSQQTDRNRVAAVTAAVAGVTLLDLLTARQLTRDAGGAVQREDQRRRGVHVKETITVARPPEEVYRFWRDFTNLPRFMAHLESVQVVDQDRSHWTAKAPAGTTVEWDAEIVEDRENELIAWRSVQHSDVDNRGSVRFAPAPGGRGTEILVELRYEPPGGVLGAAVAKLFGEEPSQQVKSDLRRFKQVMELGEVVHSDASIHPGTHPAQPSGQMPAVGQGGLS